jgi:hypothetical protein
MKYEAKSSIRLKTLGASLLVISLFACSHALSKPDPTKSPTQKADSSDPYLGNAFDENPLRWKLIAEQNGMRLYRDVDSAPGRIDLRAKTNVNASIFKVATALTDFKVRKQWLDGLVETKLIRNISEYERIEYSKIKAQYPYQFTDFVYQVTFSILRDPRMLLIRLNSVNDTSVPVAEGTVRGQITHSYNFVKEIDADHSELAMEMGLDPKGALPSWDQKSQAVEWFYHTMNNLKAVVENPKFKISTEIQHYIKTHEDT